jgi:hypothetical protein
MPFHESDLPNLIAKASIGRTRTQTIEFVKSELKEVLAADWDFVVENATVNLLKNGRRRRAQLLDGQYDLLAPFNLPGIISAEYAPGTKERVNKAFPDMSKSWLKEKIADLRNKRLKKDVELDELLKVFDAIDPHCGDDDSIASGLRRAHGIS